MKLSLIFSPIVFLGLGGCFLFPIQEARSPRCNSLIDNLQAQDTYLKGLIESPTPVERKANNARTVQENLRTYSEQLEACPRSIREPLIAEVYQRINQIDAYLSSGKWEGPVGT